MICRGVNFINFYCYMPSYTCLVSGRGGLEVERSLHKRRDSTSADRNQHEVEILRGCYFVLNV